MIGYNKINIETIDDINNITGLNIVQIINDYSDFIKNYSPKIVSYYVGRVKSIDADVITRLNKSIYDVSYLLDTITSNKNELSDNTEYWDVVDVLDEINTSLEVISNMNKWSRSTPSGAIERKISVGQEQTIEYITKKLGIDEDKWSDVAIDNKLGELDYTPYSGGSLSVTIGGSQFGILIKDVVDSMIGNNLYGKDIKSKISFSNNDIDTVEGTDCRDQLIENAVYSTFGSVPEDDSFGREQCVGNRNSMPIDTLIRQISTSILHDDVIESVNFDDVQTKEDYIMISMRIKDKVSDTSINKIINV